MTVQPCPTQPDFGFFKRLVRDEAHIRRRKEHRTQLAPSTCGCLHSSVRLKFDVLPPREASIARLLRPEFGIDGLTDFTELARHPDGYQKIFMTIASEFEGRWGERMCKVAKAAHLMVWWGAL